MFLISLVKEINITVFNKNFGGKLFYISLFEPLTGKFFE